MAFVLSKKDLLSNEEVNKVDVYFNLDEINTGEPKITDIDKKIAKIKKMKDIDYEVKSNLLSEYSLYEKAKSIKEQKQIEKRINEILKRNGL